MEKKAIGIDIGGTTIKGALVGTDGLSSNMVRIPTTSVTNGPGMVDTILDLVGNLVEKEGGTGDILGVGIGTPGFVDRDGVIVGKAVNLPGWEGTRLYEPVLERFGFRVVAANDATAMALAEARFGAGRGVKNLIGYTIGTGIGGGIVANGKLYTGSNGMAGEFGHVSIDPEGVECGCGQMGCVERYASAQGIVYWARERCSDCTVDETDFVRMVRSTGQALSAKEVYEFVNSGDPIALRVHDFICDKLARAIGIAINTIAPDLVVLGGGVMMAGPVIVDTVKKSLPKYTLPEILKACEIKAAELGEQAGVIGAGALVFEERGISSKQEQDL